MVHSLILKQEFFLRKGNKLCITRVVFAKHMVKYFTPEGIVTFNNTLISAGLVP